MLERRGEWEVKGRARRSGVEWGCADGAIPWCKITGDAFSIFSALFFSLLQFKADLEINNSW